MSERKLYEIGLRMVGILVLVRGLAAFSSGIMYVALGPGSDPMYSAGAFSSAASFLILFSAGLLLLMLAPRLAALLCPAPATLKSLPTVEPRVILPAGLIFIGVVTFVSGLAGFVQIIPDIARWLRYESSYSISVSYPLHSLLSSATRTLLGLLLIFHGKVFPKLRSGWEAVTPSAQTSAEEHPSEGPDNQDPQADE